MLQMIGGVERGVDLFGGQIAADLGIGFEQIDKPVRFSDNTGLRLCGIADEPFWPSAKNSEASRSSVRCRWRSSVANRSIAAAINANAMKNAAWRSRGMICVETGSGARPSFFAT